MKKHALAIAISNALLLAPAWAESTSQEEQPTQLQEIKVIGSSFSQQVGTQKISAQQIKRMPSTNGNITELLKNNPNVVFSNNANLSTNGGEIKPDEISFHGAKFYENNFMIDGISNDDNINPLGSNAGAGNENRPAGYEAYDLPGGSSQSFWLNTSLLKNVEVFDSNISAKYGNFTGGVVNAELKDPDFEKATGEISFRTTRSAWAKLHIQDETEDEFQRATSLSYQPYFKKRTYDLNVSQPFSDNFALLFAYNRTEADIKYLHPRLFYLDNPNQLVYDKQTRLNENYLLKGVYFTENGDQWKGTLIYSPHKSANPKANVVNGRMTSTGGGYSGLLEWAKQFDTFKMETQISYKNTGDEVEHDESVYRTYLASKNVRWNSVQTGRALYGGFGKFYTEKSRYTLKQDFTLDEFDWGETSHRWIVGWKAEMARAKFQRDQDIYQYRYTKASNVVCGSANECISEDQYASSAQLYPQRNVTAKDDTYSIYAEDNIRWKRLELNLGVRGDYNRFLRNFDVSPRLSFAYDVTADQTTKVFGGFSRYYGRSMLAYALRENIGQAIRFERDNDTNGSWRFRSNYNNTLNYRNANLKTPYNQEVTAGISQRIGDLTATLKWVRRDGKNEFSRKQVNGAVQLANDGWSKTNNFTFTLGSTQPLEFKYAKFNVGLGFRRSVKKTNNNHYDAKDFDDIKYAAYHNKIIDQRTLTSPDFNSPWEIEASLLTEFPALRLTWDQRLTYKGKRNVIEQTNNGFNCKDPAQRYRAVCGNYLGQDIDVIEYQDATQGRQFVWDWRFSYKQPLTGSKYLTLTLDVNNVLNTTSQTRGVKGKVYYSIGRNFWAGASYHW